MSCAVYFARCAPPGEARVCDIAVGVIASSFLRYVEGGVYEAGWGQGQMDFEGDEYE